MWLCVVKVLIQQFLEVFFIILQFLFLISFWMLKEYTTSQRIFRLVTLGTLSIFPLFGSNGNFPCQLETVFPSGRKALLSASKLAVLLVNQKAYMVRNDGVRRQQNGGDSCVQM